LHQLIVSERLEPFSLTPFKSVSWVITGDEILKKINDSLDFNHEMDAVDPMKALVITADTKKNGLGYISPKKWENLLR
jgi:hypothetical protein